MAVGLALMLIFAIYPLVFTIWVAFTNYGDGHLLTKNQAIEQIQKELYLPEEGSAFSWTAFKTDDGDYALWLLDSEGTGYFVRPGETPVEGGSGLAGIGPLDARGIPESIEGYTKLNTLLATADPNLPNIKFGVEGSTIQIRSPSEAAELLPRYSYDEVNDLMVDLETGREFRNVEGTFTAENGDAIRPGFREQIGVKNFRTFFESSTISGPLLRIVTWNFVFAILSVLMTFSLGLGIALMFNDPDFPYKKIIRSFLLIPYTIPSLITILIWRGMMNPEIGIINTTLNDMIGWAPPWFTDPTWAKIAILLVNLWLGYPYFMLITSGALQSIPHDIYQAAEVDGASTWQKFWRITLPLLLVSVGPLMVASFTFNFNNFNLIFLFIGGGPPIAGASTRAGHTDILISYVFNLAFEGGRGVNYGLASAITIVIFLIVGAITLFQFRFTNMWEEVSENV
jgi:ABC-type sugar transport system permease subunit